MMINHRLFNGLDQLESVKVHYVKLVRGGGEGQMQSLYFNYIPSLCTKKQIGMSLNSALNTTND